MKLFFLSFLKKNTLWILLAILISIVLYWYWQHSKNYPSTDNAYVGANVVQIAPQISGPIQQLFVKNFDQVSPGQLLFTIDPTPFQVSVDQAQSKLDITKQNVKALEKDISAAEALFQQKLSELKLAEQNNTRIQSLVKVKQLPAAEGDKAIRDVNVAKSALREAQQHLQKLIETLGSRSSTENAEIRSAQADLNKTKLNLGYTQVTSPIQGYIVNLTIRTGTMVTSGVPLFSIVDSKQWWVDANYKETQLERIRPGQHARIVIDLYPHHTFHGLVQNISRGSGAAFSLFPAENATGNWVKVTQRFPIRIYITDPDPQFPLRIGASSTVTIDTVHGH